MAAHLTTGYAQFQKMRQTYFNRKFLEDLYPSVIAFEYGEKRTMPAHEGATKMRLFRYDRLSPSSIYALPEGGTIANETDITVSQIEIDLEQFGATTSLSTLLQETAIDPKLMNVQKQMSRMASEGVDNFIYNKLLKPTQADAWKTSPTSAEAQAVIDTGTDTFDVIYGGDATKLEGAGEVDATDVMTSEVIRKGTAKMRSNACPVYPSGSYVCLVHPNIAMTLTKDGDFIAWNQHSNAKLFHKAQVGELANVIFISSQNCPSINNGTTKVYMSLLLSPGAYAINELATRKGLKQAVDFIVKEPNPYDTSNPFNTYTKVSFKILLGVGIQDRRKGLWLATASLF
ncbi:MAG: N4-gp56 family major capsid protein [Bacillota bacterium]